MLDHDSRQAIARKTFSWFRVFIVTSLVIFAFFLLIVFLGNHTHDPEIFNRIKCSNNLKQIGLAFQLYAQDNHGQFPRGIYDPTTADKPVAFTHAEDNAGQLFTGANAPVNDVTVPFLQLLQLGEIDSSVLVCQSTNATAWPPFSQFPGPMPRQTLAQFSNIPKPEYLSYSINNPYLKSDDLAARDAWWTKNDETSTYKVTAADMNPGAPELQILKYAASEKDIKQFGNSRNHDGTGQNILFGDGHVEWRNTPFYDAATGGYPSPNEDNIYTYGTGANQGIIGSSTGPDDAVLLPTEHQK